MSRRRTSQRRVRVQVRSLAGEPVRAMRSVRRGYIIMCRSMLPRSLFVLLYSFDLPPYFIRNSKAFY